jgi:hypothetical protein
LTEKIDITTPHGKLIFHLMGALAELERMRCRHGSADYRMGSRFPVPIHKVISD